MRRAGRSHLGDSGIAADHRHDSFVLVAEVRGFLAGNLVEDVASSPSPGLLSDGPELGERSAVLVRNIRRIAEHIDLSVPGHRQVWLHVDSAAMSLLDTGCTDHIRSLFAAAPHHRTGHDLFPVAEDHAVRRNLFDADTEMQRHAIAFQLLRSVGMSLVREWRQQHFTVINEVNRRGFSERSVRLWHDISQSFG